MTGEDRSVPLSAAAIEALRARIAAQRRTEPWPEFGAYGDTRQAARDGFNAALDVVDDILAAGHSDAEPGTAMHNSPAITFRRWVFNEMGITGEGAWTEEFDRLFAATRSCAMCSDAEHAGPCFGPGRCFADSDARWLETALAEELVKVVRFESEGRVLSLSVEDRARRWAISIARRLTQEANR